MVDSEILAGRAFSQYLAKININLSEKEFSKTYAGNKLIEVVSKLSSRFNIKNQEVFFKDAMTLAHTIYTNELTAVSGVKRFLDIIHQKKLISSNSGKQRIIDGLKKVNLNKYFDEKNIFSIDIVNRPKPYPDIYKFCIKKGEKVLIIGDNIRTDIKGANNMEFDSLFITDGIHKDEFFDLQLQNYDKILKKYGAKTNYYQKRLTW